MEDKAAKMDWLAREILTLSRNTLLVNLRFLDAALSQFQYVPVDTSTLLTEGTRIFYNPAHVLRCYRMEKEIPVRDYLHMVLHCVFRHMYMDPTLDRPLWDLACDIAVEHVICGLELRAVQVRMEPQKKEQLQKLEQELKYITAETVYHYLHEKKISPRESASLRAVFYSDDHSIWYMTEKERRAALGLPEEEGQERQWIELHGAMGQTWQQIAERMQMDVEAFGKGWGIGKGALAQNLKAVNRERYDYTAFLKKFAVLGETMKLNDEEFDYVYYTYGLQLYDRMPLIEPLEYKEVKRIREFAIAIDTSGSTSGELVQAFVQKTYNILKSAESFFTRIDLHILQCDAEIQEDVKITSQEEFDAYLRTMKIRGLGGTDFRPVFTYVDELIRRGEFTNLKGLLYFTDGCGEFPKKKPSYQTAFVYLDDGFNNPNVPPWAIRLVLKKEDLLQEKGETL